MQLDLDKKSDSEKIALLTPYNKVSALVVVVCGRFMIKHLGQLVGFNPDGSVLALKSPTEKTRIVYLENDFEERSRNPDNPKDKYQYIPTKYVDKVVLPDNIFVGPET